MLKGGEMVQAKDRGKEMLTVRGNSQHLGHRGQSDLSYTTLKALICLFTYYFVK